MEKSEITGRYLDQQISDAELIEHFQKSRKSKVKKEGAVYTPKWIVNQMLDMAGINDISQTVIEPACGHGSFVLPLIRHAKQTFNLSWRDARDWFILKVTCLDVNADVVSELKQIVSLLFEREGVPSEPENFKNIICADGLSHPLKDFDIALGNPPYIRNNLLDGAYRKWLRSTFEVAASGNIDIYYIFLDRYMRAVKRCVFIVPNGCFKTSSARILRDRVFPLLEEIIDFKSQLVFTGARTYTCILASSLAHDGPCSLRIGLNGSATLTPWQALTGSEIHSAKRVARSGLATLADRIFFIRKDPQSGKFVARHGETDYEIEPGIIRPVFKVSKSFSIDRPDRFAIFPYRSYSGQDFIPEDELAQEYPNCYAYLKACRAVLDARDGGKTHKYPIWYAYGRSQGLHDLSSRVVVFVPRIIGGNAVPRQVDTTSITKKFGGPLFVSGFALEVAERSRNLLLSDSFLEYIQENGNEKPGKTGVFYAISSKHVNAFLASQET